MKKTSPENCLTSSRCSPSGWKKQGRHFTVCILALFFHLIAFNTQAQFTKLLDFDGPNGGQPNGSELFYDGTFLYGMTSNNGANNLGVMFKIKPDGTGYVKLLDFAGLTNGSTPLGALISDGTFLYGMTANGGANDLGTIFKIMPDGTGYVKLLDFAGSSNGDGPWGKLTFDGTFLYGMTEQGGTNNIGTIFKIKPDGTGYVKLLDFASVAHGRRTYSSLLSDGTFLYGMAQFGGINNKGTIFKIKPDGTGFVKLFDFDGANGENPMGTLIYDGTFLYGMTRGGGSNSSGTVFKIKPDGTGHVRLTDFTGVADGHSPMGSLVANGGFLFGMGQLGGTSGFGTIFKIRPDGTEYAKIHDFTNATGSQPKGSLISNGPFLYGMTSGSGAFNQGTVFKFLALPTLHTITDIAPAGSAPGGILTINGTNFNTTPSQNIIYFGTTKATASTATSTQLTVVVPAGASYGPITVVNLSGGLQAQSPLPFTPTFPDGGRIIPASYDPKFDINLDPVAGNNVNGLAMADLDGDGWNDLAVSEQALNAVSIFRNLGSGAALTEASFDSKISVTGAGNQPALYTVDLDGDGKLDIITGYADVTTMHFATFRNISTPGNLSFEPVELWPGLVYSGTVASVVDVDGDGLLDLIAQHGNGSVSPDLWIAKNMSSSGNIQFGASVSYFGGATLDAGAGVTASDLNNDGKPEMIVKHSFGGQFSIIENTSTPGAISFGTPFTIVQSVNGGIRVADFNLDGKNDLAWKQGFSNDDVHIRINTNSGGALAAADFATEVILDSDLNYYGGISLGDVNGDGKTDILATDGADFGVFENTFAGGAFTASSFASAYKRPGDSSGAPYPTSIVAGDLNGDAKPDLVFATTNSSPRHLSIIENKNVHTPVISLTTVSPLTGPIGTTVTITGDYFSTTPTDNHVSFGTVNAAVLTATKTQLTVVVPAGAHYAPVSVTRDRLTASYHLPFNVTFSPGTSFDATSFAAPIDFNLTSAYYEVMTGDLNSDGKPDVVATGNTFDAYAFRNTHSSGAISTSSLVADDTVDYFGFNHLPTLMELDGDGKPELIAHEGQVRQNLSTLSEIDFDNGIQFEFYSLNHSSGDFNHDGKTDFVGTRFSEGKIIVTGNRTTLGPFVFYNGIQAAFSSFDIGSGAISFTKPAVFGYTAVADFDNDGWADIVATNSATNNFTAWRNNETPTISAASFTNVGDIATGDNPGRVYTGDLDVDGKIDLMMYYGGGTSIGIFSVFHNTSTPGTISFARQDYTVGAGSTGGASAIGDLDGDGKPEIVVPSEGANVFRIFKNNTTPGVMNATSFTAAPTYAVTAPRAVAIGDLNLDGKPEIIITSAPNSLLVYENRIAGVFITFTTQPADRIICEGNNTTITVVATGDTNLQYKWQVDNAGFVDLANSATYSGVTTATLTITNPALALSGSVYRCLVKGDNTSFTASNSAALTIHGTPVLSSLNPSVCSEASTGIIFNTSGVTPATSYILTSKSVVAGLTETGNAVVPATGVISSYISNDSYRNVTSGPLNVQYNVSPVSAANCIGTATAIIIPILPEPVLANISKFVCSTAPTGITLNTAVGSVPAQTYSLLDVSTQPGLTPAGSNASVSSGQNASYLANDSFTNLTSGPLQITYLVHGSSSSGCKSDTLAVVLTVFPSPCSNQAPVISSSVTSVPIEGVATIDLIALITDADNNLDLSTLRVVTATSKGGASASINGSNQLVLDYGGVLFSGTDQITIEVCDLFGECTQQQLTIEIVGDIIVYNGLSPNGDGKNEVLYLKYIELLPATQSNKVRIYNRWGDEVYSVSDYNNADRVFRGESNNGNKLPVGVYFYKIVFSGGRKTLTGYLELKY